MDKRNFWNQLLLFIVLLIALIVIREYFSYKWIESGMDSYATHIYLGIAINMVLIIVSYIFIKRNGILQIAGIRGSKLRKASLLIFPLVYLVLLNGLFLDEIQTKYLSLLMLYCISVGFAEELSIRGFIQSYVIKHFGTSKKNLVLSIFASSIFFGLLHLFKFDKGIYGEISQIFFATFIGAMFGVLLVLTKRIYPLIIIHTIIDFVAKLDSAGKPVKNIISEPTSLENSILTVLLVLPCLIYALFLIKKYSLTQQ